LVRESFLLLPLIYFVSKTITALSTKIQPNQHNLQDALPSMILVLSAAFGVLLTHLIVTPNNYYPFMDWILYWFYQKPLPSYILGYFITFGPILALLYPARTVIRKYLAQNRFHFYYLLAVSGIAWVIGSDTDRFLYWAIPVWLIMFGLTLEALSPLLTKSIALSVFLILTQLLSQRAFLPNPDFAPKKIQYRIPVLTVICNDGCSLDIPSYHGWTGPGIKAMYCSMEPCFFNGVQTPIKWYQMVEYIVVIGIVSLGIMRKQRQMTPENTTTQAYATVT
jgi:hypothetical protein